MTTCPTCGVPLAADAPAGLCPACLLRGAQPAEHDEPEIEAEMRRTMQAHARDLELGERLGRGGMGIVFRASQKSHGREVAVKVLDPALGKQPAFAERFAREAEALARLAHPNIVAVYEHGQAGELCYLVLEYVDGASLRQVLESGPLAPRRVLALVPQICAALEFAHGQGVVHRDIKPENVLLDRKERVKIADFGLAKLLDADVASFNLTSTGQVMGTLRYMAPEQLERPLTVDHRADIYSLGVVFYEMLTGEIPMGRFAPPSQKAGIDAQLDEVVLHTLDRDPELRYQSAGEVKRDVEAIGAGRSPRHALPDNDATKPRGAASGQAGPPRVSWLAVVSCALAIWWTFVVAAALWLEPVLVVSDGIRRPLTSLAISWRLFATLGLVGLLPMGLCAGLAHAATNRILAGWPWIYGLAAACTGAWLMPLFALNWAVWILLTRPFFAQGEFVPIRIAALFVAACLAFDVWWIARRRRRFMLELAGTIG